MHRSRSSSRPGARGFTLLEVVLAIGLSLTLVGAVLAFYDQALSQRQQIINKSMRSGSDRAILDRMADELRGAINYSFLGLSGTVDEEVTVTAPAGGGEFSPQSIEFVSAAVPGPAAWAVRNTTEQPIPPELDLQRVSYRLNTWPDEYGNWQVSGLQRTCQKIILAKTATEGQEISVSTLSYDINYFRIRYWDGTDWTDTWGSDNLPLAVELTIGSRAPASETDVDSTTMKRVVFLPGGRSAITGKIIRDLDVNQEEEP